jgi:peptide/nickel transport system substrate-binding protein
MWAQAQGQGCKVNASRALYFPRIEKHDTSLYLLGWGGAVTDAETTLTPVMRNPGPEWRGPVQLRALKNDRFEALAAQSSVEPTRRSARN